MPSERIHLFEFASLRESNQMKQAGFLASLIFGYLPIRRLADSGFLTKNTSPVLSEQSYSCASARDFHTVPF
jgi:hypothetical protein